MNRWKKKQPTQSTIRFERMYQYNSGEYLPDSSQPNPDENWKITASAYTPHTSTRYVNVVMGNNGKVQKRAKDGVLINSDIDLPELYSKREDCCGCTACYAVCPVQAISMRPDEEGFLYPVVDVYKCVRCYKCVGVCPIKTKERDVNEE